MGPSCSYGSESFPMGLIPSLWVPAFPTGPSFPYVSQLFLMGLSALLWG